MSRAKSSWKRVKNRLLLSILLFLVTRNVLHSAWVNLWNGPRSQQNFRRRDREIHQQRNAGFSVHSNLDLDISVPDSDLEAGIPWLLAVAGLLGLRQLKAAVDGPEEFQLQPGSLQGKNVLITGGSSGLGLETATRLAEAGAQVLITCRDLAEPLQEELSAEIDGDVAVLTLDLANLQSIHDFVAKCEKLMAGIDVIICNAGVMAVPTRCETSDGFEMQLGVNHLGHYALCGHLLPFLGRSDRPTRVVSVSSLAHRLGNPLRLLQELDGQASSYNAWAAYSDSKLANVMFAKELDRRFKAKGLMASAVSLHPGLCATDLARYVVSGKDEPLEVTYSKYAAPIQAMLQATRGMLRPIARGANSDLVECQRDGHWQPCRISRVPTDQRPLEGCFRVKFDVDAKEMKCWYKDLRAAQDPASIPMPSWLSSWQPEEAPPDENCWKHLEGRKDESLAARWRRGPPRDAVEILELERQKEVETWAEFRRKNEDIDLVWPLGWCHYPEMDG